jgi:hypothetical protein
VINLKDRLTPLTYIQAFKLFGLKEVNSSVGATFSLILEEKLALGLAKWDQKNLEDFNEQKTNL